MLRLDAPGSRSPRKNETTISSTSLESSFQEAHLPAATSNRVPSVWSTLRSCLAGMLHPNRRRRSPPSPPPTNQQTPFSPCCTTHSSTSPTPDPQTTPLILDLRSAPSFATHHIPYALSTPLPSLTPTFANNDLFGDPDAIHQVWTDIQAVFARADVQAALDKVKRERRKVVVVCYDGDAARLGTSVLRDRGVEAYSVGGGWRGLVARGVVE